ncbi:Signal transduction histidine kinase [Peptoclostridium litorale DSM 5388]|uniref:histidine kinase n=1 Tax=Peptoclostridium litorale DSM 5388 TaxID=1121324 RepID=A0A069RFE7_PEPLI|nr:HAMP domain-containing sensor histidine kinase [Peptoclostridium litorale]KDR95513.1 sensor protein GtcS [Peptoclostridium litorale DSM 5388]SIO17095.1 Signal transduction histidine kinase [Peptoclostridium litorale DSM 5388]
MGSKISRQFAINYMIMFLLIIALAVTTILLQDAYFTSIEEKASIDTDEMIRDYKSNGLEYAFNRQPVEKGDYIEVIDNDYKVLDSVNSPNSKGYVYTLREFNEMIFSQDYLGYHYVEYIDDSDRFMLLYMSEGRDYKGVLMFFIGVFIALSFMAAVVYANVTSKKIITPIGKLVEGVVLIGRGDYDFDIKFDSSNELEILKDSINSMSKKIKQEIGLREKSESNRKKLILNISHDVKTPLTNIIGYSQTLIDSNEIKEFNCEDVQRALEIINSNGVLANKLIQELFELSHIEMDEGPIKTEKADICELMRIKLIQYVNEFEDNGIDYSFDIPDGPVILDVNKIKFERAIDNIIQNSMKYNKRDFSIDVSMKSENSKVIIAISDTGVGIPKEYNSIIFEPMVRVENSRNREFGGSGLGLSITRHIIEKHGGTISLDSAYESGCRFVIEIDHF